jgi:hypothetical protein
MTQEIHPSDIDVFEESHLFLTNKVKGDNKKNELDSIRLHKVNFSYIEVNSAARNNPPDLTFQEQTLKSTGQIYNSSAILYPYNADELPTIENNRIQFQLKDVKYPLDEVQIANSIYQYEILDDLYTFNVIFPVTGISTLGELADSIKYSLNQLLYLRAGTQLLNSTDPKHIFNVTAHIDQFLNPDKITITITCETNYKFIMTFLDVNNTYTDQVYPNSNNYSLYLNTIYYNIKQIRIIDADIPFSDTIINSWNMTVQFSIRDSLGNNILDSNGNSIWNYLLELGNYSNDVSVFLQSFEMQINQYIFNQTNNILYAHIFTINYVKNTGEITINCEPNFSFEMEFINYEGAGARNLYVMLGFKKSSTYLYTKKFTNLVPVNNGGGVYYFAPYGKINFAISKIIWININDFETIYDTYTNMYYFNKYPINELLPIEQTYVVSTERSIAKLDISLYDENGLPYNTNNVDHKFTLEIIWYADRFTGMNISSTRGSENVK